METKSPVRSTPQLIIGLLVIVIGVLFTLDNLNILDARDYTRYWPILLMIYGIAKMVQPYGRPGRVWGFIVFAFGSLLLLQKLDLFYFHVWDLWPVFLIVGGGMIMWRAFERQRRFSRHTVGVVGDQSATLNHFVMMGGLKRISTSQDFRGGEITAIMGGVELDLRGASISSGDAVLEVFAFWGGIEIKVPQDWTVIAQAAPILGGIEDKTLQPKETTKKLIITGNVVMGGIEIKN